ncbi:NADPH-dependent F420 reductase [Cryptosporangium sp. NPDC051539]|uniref:NADPH-dependent F420 reductase n=1 Tax=Cryptosporangium sp. NPDC051539 TaxID=3363962 RepID=UPI0037A16228
MTTIALLGSGRVSRALAAAFAGAGHDVRVGSRDPDAVAQSWNGPSVTITGVREAAAAAEVVVNATPGETSVGRMSELKHELEGKILVDVANATRRGAGNQPGELIYPNGSLAEELQAALPAVRVVKALNTVLFMVMAAPDSLSAPPTAFVSGDDEDAKSTVRGLLADIGWPGERVLDLGGIQSARGAEAMILLVPYIMKAWGMKPFALTVLS